MTIKPSDFLHAAKVSTASELEVDWRNATSRAYYSAYHRAHQSVDLCPENGHLHMGSHERLADRFSRHEARVAKSIAIILQSMKRYRHSADYDIGDPFDRSIATNQVAQAGVIAQKLDAFDESHRAKSA